jgi:cell division protein FtsQ
LMAVRAPADKRFRRAQVKPARRRRPWSGRVSQLARTATMLAVLLYGIYRGASLVLSAEALQITRIAVSGNVRLSKGEVVALLDGLRGRSMVTADLERWRRKLMSSPWVADAAIRRVLPGTIAVVILERQPMGIARLGTDLYLIDQRGTLVDQFGPNYAEFDLPIIDGLSSAPRDGGTLVDEERAALAARLLATLQTRPDLAKRVSQVDVSDSRDAVVILKDDTALVRLGDDAFVERLQSYLDLAPTLRERVEDIDYVDLRFDDRIYVKGIRGQGSGVRGKKASGIRGQGSRRDREPGVRGQAGDRTQGSRSRRQRSRGGE